MLLGTVYVASLLMILRLIYSIAIIGLAAMATQAQESELKLTTHIDGSFDVLITDHIGRVYLTQGHELFLYSSEGKLMYQFSDLSRGEITDLDVRNPLKLLLFYPDYAQIRFLDNTLSETQEIIELNNLGLELTQLACTSFDNGFWLYDPVSFRLVRYDQSLSVTNDISNINVLTQLDLNPNQMVEHDSWLYMNDPNHGVFVFDSFGTYTKLIPIVGARRISVRSNGLFFEMEDKLIKYNPFNFNQVEIELPISDYRSVRIENKKLFFLTDNGVKIYSYQE